MSRGYVVGVALVAAAVGKLLTMSRAVNAVVSTAT